MSRPSTTGSGAFSASWSKRLSSTSSRSPTAWRSSFGSSNPIRLLPGIGATIRTLRDNPSARSSTRTRDLADLRACLWAPPRRS